MMKNTGIGIKVVVASMVLLGLTACEMEDHDDDHRSEQKPFSSRFSNLDVAPVENAQYGEECGSCHFAYQPGLLPVRSWQSIMAGLDDHFGENAELGESDRKSIEAYLVENAAESSDYKRPKKILSSLKKGETPLRISETRYFVRKHHELSKSMVQGNPKVKSFSACQACHVNADKGSFNEHEIRIPGYG
jgi:hypothetical protein